MSLVIMINGDVHIEAFDIQTDTVALADEMIGDNAL